MPSGFSNSSPDFFTGAFAGKPHPRPYTAQLPDLLSDPSSQILRRLPEFPGKRSLAEFQAHHQQQQALSFYLRNVRQKITSSSSSPISTLSTDNYNISSSNISYGYPVSRPRTTNLINYANLIKQDTEKEKMMSHRLQELEKQLLDDDEEEVSVITNSEWSDTYQHLIGPPVVVSLSPTSSSSSSSCSSSPTLSPKHLLIEAATAISENKTELGNEILTRVSSTASAWGTAEQRLTSYFVSALRSRVSPTTAAVSELFGEEHALSTQMLYEVSPVFKLGFMAANLAILEATSDFPGPITKLHIIDFDIGRGEHYVHLIHALSVKDGEKKLRITAISDLGNGLKSVGDGLKALATKVGVSLIFDVLSLNINELVPEKLGLDGGEILAVNLSFRLYKLPDESVTTENLRDELLRRVKGLSPAVVTLVEQEMNTNTAPFLARVNDACGYYGALFESLDSTVSRDNSDRVKIEEGLSRKLANSVAGEGRERVERCEVFGKWRARMGMAGFKPRPMIRPVAEALKERLYSGTRGNPGFTVKEENGGVLFGWMGRTLTVASAWQ